MADPLTTDRQKHRLFKRYTALMSLTLDPQTEQRIQQELSRGGYAEPADLINHALDVLNTEEHWSVEDRARFDKFLDQRMAEAAEGKLYTAEEAKRLLDLRIAERAAAKAS